MERQPLIISLGFHVGVAMLAWIGLPSIKRDLPDEQPIVVLEMVQSVPITNLRQGYKPNTAKLKQKAARTKTPPPPPPPSPPRAKPKALDPVLKPSSKAPDQTAEILPQKVAKKPLPKPEIARPRVPPKAKPNKAAKQKTPKRLPQSPPQRVNKLARKEALDKQRATTLSGVMQNLAKFKVVSKEAEKKRIKKERKEAAKKLSNNLTVAAGNALRAQKNPVVGKVGLSDLDRIKQHVKSCWEVAPGTADLHTHIVDIIVTLDRDGAVLTANVDKKMLGGRDRTTKIAEAEAVRTIIKCSPLPVPSLDLYEQWKTIIFPFDYSFLKQK